MSDIVARLRRAHENSVQRIAGSDIFKEAADAIEAAQMARTRLEDFADKANAGVAQAGGRELKRKIWGAFSDFDAAMRGGMST